MSAREIPRAQRAGRESAIIAGLLAASVIPPAAAGDVLLEPVAQSRCVSAHAWINYPPDEDSCSDCAGGFEPYDRTCEAEVCGLGRSSQTSSILDAALVCAGTATADAFLSAPTQCGGDGHSDFSVLFDLPHRSAVTVAGQVSVVSGYAAFATAFLRLAHPSGEVILQIAVEGSDQEEIDERVFLEPGRYRFEAESDASSEDGFAGASHSAELSVDVCIADLNADRAVDFDDLLILLGFWGPCGQVCVGDIDGDEAVGFDDLLILLTSWGPCE